ncbi:MAG: hypothetical protein ACRBN8_22665 [Nannocystales bacterium]
MPLRSRTRRPLVVLLCAATLSCTKSPAAPTTVPSQPSPADANTPAPPLLAGVYTEAQPSDDTLLHELYVAFDGQAVRVGHRMLGEPEDAAIPTSAKLCEVYFDTNIQWTPTGFVVATAMSAESQVGSVSVFLETEEDTSGSFSFDGSSCEVQLVPGEYKVEPTTELGPDGRPAAFVLHPPAGSAQRFTAAEPTSFQDLGQALWDALPQAAN